MLPAFFTVFLFAASASCATKPAVALGGASSNFWRLLLAAILLWLWWLIFDFHASRAGLNYYLLSGFVGFGLGDLALYHTFPRLGSRLSMLMIHCFGAPIGALIEWYWLGTPLTSGQILFAALILIGVAIALVPNHAMPVSRKTFLIGIGLGLFAAIGQCLGAVISRKASLNVIATGATINGLTAGAQRVGGGIWVAGIAHLFSQKRKKNISSKLPQKNLKNIFPEKSLWGWIFANGLFGPFLGVGTYQWALATNSTGVVLPIVALTPLAVIPFAYLIEKERPSFRSILGSCVAVIGTVGLAWITHHQ